MVRERDANISLVLCRLQRREFQFIQSTDTAVPEINVHVAEHSTDTDTLNMGIFSVTQTVTRLTL